MSYLLEALRKSERERQEKSPVPGLQTPTVEWESGEDTRTRSPWLMVAVLAICLNTILLAVLVWRFGFANDNAATSTRSETATAAPTAGPAPAQSATTLPAATPATSAMPPVIVLQQPTQSAPAVIVREREPTSTRLATENSRSVRPLPAAQTSQNENRRAEPTTTAASSEPAPGTDAELISVHELPLATRQQLPPLSMNSHIYANNARDSFVMINGVSLSPGQAISDGVQLVAVVPEGAVLSFQGQRFLLPALASFTP